MIHIEGDKASSKLTNVEPVDVQPNAVDLRVGKIFKILPTTFLITNEEKIHRKTEEVQVDDKGFWFLEVGTYEIVMENTITVAPDEAGWVITRSTLNRNGLFITSGLYDSGYSGVMAGALHVTSGPAMIKQGTRVGQFLLFKADTLKTYDGDYGFGKKHDQKYS